MKRWQTTLLFFILTIAGCATPPEVHDVERQRQYGRTYDDVWGSVVAFFSIHNIQIKTIEKDSGIIYAELMEFNDRYADCGDPGITVPISQTGQFNIFVRNVEERVTEVTVNSNFRQVRQFGSYAPFAVRCNSTGSLERLVLNQIGPTVEKTVRPTPSTSSVRPSATAPARPFDGEPAAADTAAEHQTDCVIKGNRTPDGRRFYYLPGDLGYRKVVAHQWFCSEDDARRAGWQRG